MTAYTRADLGEPDVAGQTVQLSNGRLDVMQRANWHSFKVSWTAGKWNAAGLNIEIQGAGKE
jgi:hypothetical protein